MQRRCGRRPIEELEGNVRFHHIVRGELAVLDARDCAHQWRVFHTTYTFCLVVRIPPSVIRWAYGHRTYEVDRDHCVMLMQPGETHANLARTPPGTFVVVQVGEGLMHTVARALGWRSSGININEAHQATQHPAVISALRRFRADLCPTLYGANLSAGCCSCHKSLAVHMRNLVNLVRAFIEHCVEHTRSTPPAQGSAALVASIAELLVKECYEPYSVNDVLHEVDPGDVYNEHYMIREFSRAYGVSPGEFHNLVLASKVRDVLAAEPGKSFQRIVKDLRWPGRVEGGGGRWRAAHKHFRRAWGVTPGDFRRGANQARSVSDAEEHLIQLLVEGPLEPGPSVGISQSRIT